MVSEGFKKELENVVGEYFPSDKCLDLISSYIYAIVLNQLHKEFPDNMDILKEVESSIDVSPMMDMSFKKALKDVILFTSQNLLVETLRETFSSIRNVVPMNKNIEEPNYTKNPIPRRRPDYSPNAADFDMIDLDSIPRVDISALGIKVPDTSESVHGGKVAQTDSNEFEGDFEMDFDKINRESSFSSKGKSRGSEKSDKASDEGPDDLGQFTTDGSAFTGETYKAAPKISTDDLDY